MVKSEFNIDAPVFVPLNEVTDDAFFNELEQDFINKNQWIFECPLKELDITRKSTLKEILFGTFEKLI
jgi:hypothetical protein